MRQGIAFVSWLFLSAISIAAFVSVFMPLVLPFSKSPPQSALQIALDCPQNGGAVAALHLIPEPTEFLEHKSYLNVAIDYRNGCTRLRLMTHNSLAVHILNESMVQEPAQVPRPAQRNLKPIELIKNGRPETNEFTSYDIDLTKLGKDRWIGVSPILAARRTSFDGYEYELALQLSAGAWALEFLGHSGLEITGGDKRSTLSVSGSQALDKVYYTKYTVKQEHLSGLRELALILFAIVIGGCLTTTVAATRRLVAGASTKRRTASG